MDEAAPAIDSVATQGVVTTTCPFLTVVSENPAFSKPMVNQWFTGRNHKRGVCSIPTAPTNLPICLEQLSNFARPKRRQ